MVTAVTPTKEWAQTKGVPIYKPPMTARMPLEDVVRHYGQEEKTRRKGDSETDYQPKHIRSAVNELVSSVKVIALRLKVSQSVLTKCMARHAIQWYREMLNIESLESTYWAIFEQAKQGHSSIRKQMESINFVSEIPFESVDTHWDIPNFVVLELSRWKSPMGASLEDMLVYGFAWSLVSLQHREWDAVNIETYFLPALRHYVKMISHRQEADFEAFRSKVGIDEKLSQNSEIGINIPLSHPFPTT